MPPPLPAHPWRRYAALSADLAVWMIGWGLAFLSLPDPILRAVGRLQEHMLATTAYAGGWVFVEAALMAGWATTPGKWLFGIRVVGSGGERLTYGRAFTRGLYVFGYRLGFAIPIGQWAGGRLATARRNTTA